MIKNKHFVGVNLSFYFYNSNKQNFLYMKFCHLDTVNKIKLPPFHPPAALFSTGVLSAYRQQPFNRDSFVSAGIHPLKPVVLAAD